MLTDGSPCVPTEPDAAPCTGAQTGVCTAGRCVVVDADNATRYCVDDPFCGGALCYEDGVCFELIGGDLACAATVPGCGAAGMCNGRGQCAFQVNPACVGTALCTTYGCNTTTGECTIVAPSTPDCMGPSTIATAVSILGAVVVPVGILAVVLLVILA
jgi:hypothetical protein